MSIKTKEIQKLKDEVPCRKSFICLQSNYSQICKAADIGLDGYIKCNDEFPEKCNFSIFFGDSYMCKCAIRIHLEKEKILINKKKQTH